MVWPFKKKMTVDYLASVVAEAIEENLTVYFQAMKNHAAENVSAQDLVNLEPEMWVVELSLLDIVLPMTSVPPEMAQQLIPMLVVGYSPLEKDDYLRQAKYYASHASKAPPEEFTAHLAKAFVRATAIRYEQERPDVNREALEWALATVITGSFQGLLGLLDDISNRYRIY